MEITSNKSDGVEIIKKTLLDAIKKIQLLILLIWEHQNIDYQLLQRILNLLKNY